MQGDQPYRPTFTNIGEPTRRVVLSRSTSDGWVVELEATHLSTVAIATRTLRGARPLFACRTNSPGRCSTARHSVEARYDRLNTVRVSALGVITLCQAQSALTTSNFSVRAARTRRFCPAGRGDALATGVSGWSSSRRRRSRFRTGADAFVAASILRRDVDGITDDRHPPMPRRRRPRRRSPRRSECRFRCRTLVRTPLRNTALSRFTEREHAARSGDARAPRCAPAAPFRTRASRPSPM